MQKGKSKAIHSGASSLGWVIYVGCVVALPKLMRGFPVATHDGVLHQLWLTDFFRQFCDGEVYPRWLMGMNAGRGSPVFFYYPPIPYWLTSLVTAFWPDLDSAYRLGWGAAVALVCSGLAAYRWLITFLDNRSGMAGAIIYMISPYHWAVDLYQRGAFAELWSFVWLPCLLCAAQRLIDHKPHAIPGLALAWALLLMTHPPTALIAGALPILWVVWRSESKRLDQVVWCGASQLLGFALAAVYLVPALTERDHVQMEAMHEDDMHYSHSFLLPFLLQGSFQAAHSAFASTLFPVLLCGWLVALSLGAAAWCLDRANRPITSFWLAVMFASAAMMLPLTSWLYQVISPLQLIQFPWRFGILQVMGSAALSGLFLHAVRRTGRIRLATWLAVCLGLSTAIYSVHLTKGLSQHWTGSGHVSDRLSTARDAPEYKPRWVHIDAVQDITSNHVRGSELPIEVIVTQWAPRRISLEVRGERPAEFELERYYHPGWQAASRGGPQPSVGPSREGLLRVGVQAGADQIELRFERSDGERLGAWISAGAAIVILLGRLVGRYRNRSEHVFLGRGRPTWTCSRDPQQTRDRCDNLKPG